MRDDALPAGEVTVLGGNEVGLNAAAYAAQLGRRTTVVHGDAEPGHDMNPLLADHTRQILDKMGVLFANEDPANAPVRLFAGDNVAVDGAVRRDHGGRWLSVGARVTGGRLYQATQSGFWAGCGI